MCSNALRIIGKRESLFGKGCVQDYPEEAAALVQLRLEEIHILEDVPRKDIHNKSWKLQISLFNCCSVFGMNRFILTMLIRRLTICACDELAYALDRQMISDVVFDGHALESVGPYHS